MSIPRVNAGSIDTGVMIGRILLSILLSGLIGIERKFYHKPAGFRTNIMVGLGSTLLMLLGIFILSDYSEGSTDITRIVGQIVTGIGFLGAGAIIQGRGSIHGLTTAASIWVVAAIGMIVGLGYYMLAIIGTCATLLVLIVMGRIEHEIEQRFNRDHNQPTTPTQ